MKKIVVAPLSVTAIAALLLLAWWNQMFEPRKNVFGRASQEKQLSECSPDSGKTNIRLYRGEPGATDSFWYSVTASSGDLKETQFFYTYGEPEITALECKDGTISLSLSPGQPRLMSVSEVLASAQHPIGIKKGVETK